MDTKTNTIQQLRNPHLRWKKRQVIRGTILTSTFMSLVLFAIGEGDISEGTIDTWVASIANIIQDGFLKIYVNFAKSDGFFEVIKNNPFTCATTAGLAICFYKSLRAKVKTKLSSGTFFTEEHLLTTPEDRIGYSDRMAYLMGELSELAYHPVEIYEDAILKLYEKLNEGGNPLDDDTYKRLIKDRLKDLHNVVPGGQNIATFAELEEVLNKGNFSLVQPYICTIPGQYTHQNANIINEISTQGFVCYKQSCETCESFIVVVFRGSEQRIEDWLTNADAMPFEGKDLNNNDMVGEVHRGFYGAFCSVAEQVKDGISVAREVLGDRVDKRVPVFFTGHSLGGAIAMICVRELYPDSNGACYTFGAPRLGDYDFFKDVKTPIYRVVNSSDVVPRVPPGFYTKFLQGIFSIIRWIWVWRTGMIGKNHWLYKLEVCFDKLSRYRHTGDLRYLTDTPANSKTQARLLSNPCRFDQIAWFFKHIAVSFGHPLASHSLQIYRKKLTDIARSRNQNS